MQTKVMYPKYILNISKIYVLVIFSFDRKYNRLMTDYSAYVIPNVTIIRIL